MQKIGKVCFTVDYILWLRSEGERDLEEVFLIYSFTVFFQNMF